ncbi:MAG TPA: pitrilysin family protein [Patescibacteria group bacterium]|nr:pitrilysin family protein [Patescibacteria group bacterium]
MKTMRTTAIFGLAIALACIFAAPASAQVKDYKQLKFPEMRPFTVPQPERITLPNGMVVMLLEDHELPLIQISTLIRAGARLEPGDKVGLGTVFGQTMRTGGTRSMTGDQVDDFLEARAATIETGVQDEFATANMSCLSQDFPDVMKVFVEILRNPVFAEEKIKIAKNQLNTGISRRNDNPQGIMNREFEKLVYGADSVWARTPEYATVEKITRDDLIAYHKQYFVPNRVLLGVTGDFDAKQMATRIKQAFADWPKGPEAKDPPPAWQTTMKPGISYVQKEDMTQSDIIMGHLGIKRDDPDFFAVEVLNEAFGGGFAARLFSNVRSKKGLAYSVRGGVESNFSYPGTFNCWMTTKTETTAAGVDALLEEIDNLVKNPPSASEVGRAKESILNSFVFNFDSRSKILRQQLSYEYFGFPLDYLSHYRQNIDKVTVEDVARVAKKFVHKDQLAILVVGPSKGLDRPLESFGKVAKLDITIPEGKAAGAQAPAATADSVAKGKASFARMVEALGGEAAVDSVKSLRTVASATRKTPMGEMEVKVTSIIALPDHLRQEMSLPQGQVVIVMSGNEGFLNTPMGIQALPDSQRAEFGRGLKRQPWFIAQHRNDPEFKVQLAGQETVEGAATDVLLVSLAGDDIKMFVDSATGRVVRESYRSQGPAGPGEVVASFSDFRKVSGLTFPFKSVRTMNGEPQDSGTTQEITVNPQYDAALFAKPEGAAATGGGQK